MREHAATTAHRVAAGRVMRDNNKMAYDRNAGRVQSSIAGRVRNAQERLRRLEADPVPEPPRPLRFRGTFARPATSANDPHGRATTSPHPPLGRLPTPASGTDAPAQALASANGTLVELCDVRVGNRLHVERLTIRAGDRLLIHGANGAGKSTLLRQIAERARGRVGYLPQEVSTIQPCGSWTPTTTALVTSVGPRCWPPACSGLRRSISRWARSPWGSGAGWPWPVCWRASTICCCSTSRPTICH